jgi:hypothetical protein
MTTPKETTACALCGTDPALGHAIVYDDAYPPGQATHLCHGENQKISCYVQWTVYGVRPKNYPSKPKPPSKVTELAQEFRRLADQAGERAAARNNAFWRAEEAVQETWNQAAQMLEERLNG